MWFVWFVDSFSHGAAAAKRQEMFTNHTNRTKGASEPTSP